MNRKKIFNVILFLIIFILLQFIVGFLLKGDLDSNSRIMMHELHSIEKIDTLFVGASHVYRGIDPRIIDKELNCSSFVGSTASQTMEGSYAIIREAKSFHPELKTVFVDIDYALCFTKLKDKNLDLRRIYAVSNYLQNKEVKREYLQNATSLQQVFYNLSSMGKGKITVDPKKIAATLFSQINGKYWKYEYPIDKVNNEYYEGRGFIAAERGHPDKLYNSISHTTFDESEVSIDWLNALNRIIKFCKEEDIELNFISIPESNYFVLSHNNYDDFHDFVEKLLLNTNCNFYDFNLINDQLLKLLPNDFYDDNHLNREGAEKFDYALTKVIQNRTSAGDFFYTNIDDKKSRMEKDIYGITIVEADDKKSFQLVTMDNLDSSSVISFDYILVDNNQNERILSLNTQDRNLDYPENFSGRLKINCYIDNEYNCTINQEVHTCWIK